MRARAPAGRPERSSEHREAHARDRTVERAVHRLLLERVLALGQSLGEQVRPARLGAHRLVARGAVRARPREHAALGAVPLAAGVAVAAQPEVDLEEAARVARAAGELAGAVAAAELLPALDAADGERRRELVRDGTADATRRLRGRGAL